MAKRKKRDYNRSLAPSAVQLGDARKIARASLILVGGVILAWLAFMLAVSGIARHRAPAQALSFVPWEGIALATNGDLMMETGKRIAPVALENIGREAIRSHPVNPRALRLMASAAEMRRDDRTARALITKSADMSRRDLITQLWLIEATAAKGDANAVLSHFDIALRTKRSAPSILYPRLARAIDEPAVRAALAPYMRAGAPWTASFVEFAKDEGPDLTALTDLMLETGGLRNRVRNLQLQNDLFDRLLAKERFADMQRLYVGNRLASRGRLTSVALHADDSATGFGAMHWQLLDDAEAGGQFSAGRPSEPTTLSVFANGGVTRPVARKLLFLPAGSHRFTMSLSNVNAGVGAGLAFRMRCLDPGRVGLIWQTDAVTSGISANIAVPAGCRVQMFELILNGGGNQSGLEAVVTAMALSPI